MVLIILNSFRIDLPDNVNIAYKKTEVMPITILYEAVSEEGRVYIINKNQFDKLSVPFQLNDNLYRLPNGNYISSYIK